MDNKSIYSLKLDHISDDKRLKDDLIELCTNRVFEMENNILNNIALGNKHVSKTLQKSTKCAHCICHDSFM